MARQSKRSIALRKLAHELEGRFLEREETGLLELIRDFKIFARGVGKKIYNIIEFVDGDVKLYVFDYKYDRRSQNSKKTFRQTILFINSKKLGLPDFSMKPEHLFHRFGQWLNLSQDIDFDHYPEFSKQYYLKGPHENFIRYTFNENVLEFFNNEKGWSMEGLNYFFLFYKESKLIRIDYLRDFIRKGLHLYEVMQEEEE